MNKIAIAGYTGFIGSKLKNKLVKKGYDLVLINREDFLLDDESFRKKLIDCSTVINLCGSPVIKRWNAKNKKKIISSRVNTTRKIVDALELINSHKIKLINASAIGIYLHGKRHTEESTVYENDFLSDTVKQWEETALHAQSSGHYVGLCRFGVVMGKQGGAFPKMILPFKIGFGGKIGSGNQTFSYIHIKDVVEGIIFLILNKEMTGIFNFVAPDIVSNQEFTDTTAKIYDKKAFFTVPAFLVKLFLGKASVMLLEGADVIPERLLESGFKFKYDTLEKTLISIKES